MAGQILAVTYEDWKALTEERLEDAAVLFAAERWSALYYLSGYAAECGLKACLVKYVERTPHIVFSTKKFSENCWTHSLVDLARFCGLEDARDAAFASNSLLKANWTQAIQWDEHSRYSQIPRDRAEKLYQAITDQHNGVMSWIKSHW